MPFATSAVDVHKTHLKHLLGSDVNTANGLAEHFRNQGGKAVLNSSISSQYLKELGDLLCPPQTFKTQANQHIVAITQALQQDAPLNIARFFVGGGYGRHTSVGSFSDMELLVFIRGTMPPYHLSKDGIMAEIYRRLSKRLPRDAGLRDVVVEEWRPGQTAVKIHIGRIRVIVYATPRLGIDAGEDKIIALKKMTKAYEEEGVKATEMWSAALVETCVRVTGQEEPDVISFIRLCRYWSYVHDLPLSFYAAETLALRVVRNQRRDARQRQKHIGQSAPRWDLDAVEAFTAFLRHLANPQSLTELSDIAPPATYVWPWTNHKEPVLVDVVNPYKNTVAEISPTAWRDVVHVAEVTLQRLEENSKEPISIASLLGPIRNEKSAPVEPIEPPSKERYRRSALFRIAPLVLFMGLIMAVIGLASIAGDPTTGSLNMSIFERAHDYVQTHTGFDIPQILMVPGLWDRHVELESRKSIVVRAHEVRSRAAGVLETISDTFSKVRYRSRGNDSAEQAVKSFRLSGDL